MSATPHSSRFRACMLILSLTLPATSQTPFATRCSGCHGEDATGSAKGPGLANNPRVAEKSVDQLAAYLQRGNPAAGMPAFNDVALDERTVLARYLRRINNETIVGPVTVLEPASRITWSAPREGDWPTYNGNDSGNRYSRLKEINRSNVAHLGVKWIFPMASFGLEMTPIAADGILYVTGPNQVYALDALTGSPRWHFSRPATPGIVDDAKLGTNRGVAILGDKVFYVTDNAHLLALDRGDGHVVWESAMVPEIPGSTSKNYGGTVSPLVVHDTVVVGVAGADAGIRGFIAAFKADTGALAWRLWTVPRAGEPGIETWGGKEPLTGGGSSWLTGSFDAASDTLYWATGNPWPDGNDRDRQGDNLYTDCVLALNPHTGEIKWHYQFTPRDVKDRDATEPNVLVDTTWRGKPSKLLLHADRNGFFYVLDRTNGHVLLGKPFIRRNDWAEKIGDDGKPVIKDPRGCPADAANWDATAWSPTTRLYYVLALEECTGKPTGYPDQTGERFLRALNIETGEIAWEVPQPGPPRAKTWSGVLGTAGGLLFYGQPNGGFTAVDERNGKTLWTFPTNVRMKAGPMTFTVGKEQYVAVAAGSVLLCFGLPQ